MTNCRKESYSSLAGSFLRRMLKRYGYTQESFADEFGVSTRQLRRWLHEGINSLDTVQQLLIFFDANIGDVFIYEDAAGVFFFFNRTEYVLVLSAFACYNSFKQNMEENNMNLKEAFRTQNKIQSLTDECIDVLDRQQNIVKVKEIHQRNKVMPEAEDEVVESSPANEFASDITALTEFIVFLLDEKEKLCSAVRAAKSTLDIDIDGESGLNFLRQRVSHTFREMVTLRSSEEIIRGGGCGYKFNAEGNQTAFKCDLKRITTINFDRNKLKKQNRILTEKIDEISAKIDSCIVNTPVDYEAPFDVNDTLSEIFESFLENRIAT